MDMQKFQRLVGVMDKLAQTEKGERMLGNLSQRLYKMAETYNPIVFLFALIIAIMGDATDYVPVTIILDSVIGLALKGFVAYLTWSQYGKIKKTLLKKIIIWFVIPFVDTLLGYIPFVELASPVTTIMVLFTWRSARNEHFKNMEQARELEEEKNLLSAKKQQLAKTFNDRARAPEDKETKKQEITDLDAYKKSDRQQRKALEEAA